MEPMEANVQTQPGKRLAEEPKRKKGGKGWKIALGAVVLTVVVLFGACCMLANFSSTFFPHTHINGVAVDGLTVEEAQARLEAEIPQRICKIYLSTQDAVSPESREPDASITFEELGLFPEDGYERMAKTPFILQHGKGYLSTGFTYLKALLGKDTGYNGTLYWDSQQLDQAMSKLSATLNIEPIDTTCRLEDHSLYITTAKEGRSVADNELRRSIQNAVHISSEAEAVVELPVEILPGKTILEALNTDLVCDAINTAMRELFLQIVYGRSQSAFSDDGLSVGAGLEDLGKGLRSQVGTMYGTKVKGVRYLEMAEGYVTRLALDSDDQVIGYEFVSLGKMTDFIKKGDTPNDAYNKAIGTYGRFNDAAKYIDPRKE